MQLTHRDATLDDFALLGEWNHQLIRDENHRNPMNVKELTLRMCEWVTSGAYRAIIFLRDAVPVAYALVCTSPHAHLRQLFVSRDHRREGIGTHAVEILFSKIFPPGARVSVEVLLTNERGRAFWQASGFQSYSLCMERFTEPPARLPG